MSASRFFPIFSKKKPIKTSFAFEDQSFLSREELLPIRLILELIKPELTLQDRNINKGIIILGSARMLPTEVLQQKLKEINKQLKKTPNNVQLQKRKQITERMLKNSYYLDEATKLAEIISTSPNDYVVFTGGGPGFMEAANLGAQRMKFSVSFNMQLPNEQVPNTYVTPELTFQFKYFAIRKMHFLMRAKAVAVFPGGFGTLDELFEILTLLQTKKIKPFPLMLFNKSYWNKVFNLQALIDEGTIAEEDANFITYVEKAEEAWEIIQQFYSGKA